MENYVVALDYGGVVHVKADSFEWNGGAKILSFYRDGLTDKTNYCIAVFDLKRVMYVKEDDE